MRKQMRLISGGLCVAHSNRRRKVAQHRQNRAFGNAFKAKGFRKIGQDQSLRCQNFSSIWANQTDINRNDLRVFGAAVRCRAQVLAQSEGIGVAVPHFGNVQMWRACLAIPAGKLRQIAARCVLKRREPVFYCGCLPVVAVKVQCACIDVGIGANKAL